MTTFENTVTTVQVYQVFIKATPRADLGGDHRTRNSRRKYFHGVADHDPRRSGGSLTVTRRLQSRGATARSSEWDPPRRLVHEWRSLYDHELARERDQPRHLGDRAAGSDGVSHAHS